MRYFRIISSCILLPLYIVGCKTTYQPQVIHSHNIQVDSLIPSDSSILSYYQPFKHRLEKEMNRPIGYSNHHLTKVRSQPEFLVGNFFADALLYLGKQIDSDTQLALATKDGIRAELKEGPITVGSIYELMPFENTLTVLEINGIDLVELCDFIAKTGGQPIAGFTMEIKDGKAMNIQVNGKPINESTRYKLVTYDYLANGGDYIKGILNPISRQNTGKVIRDQLIEYIEEMTKQDNNINTQLDGRIIKVN